MTGLMAAEMNPLTHVVQHPIVQWGESGFPQGLWGFTLLSNHIIMQLIAAGLLIFFLPRFVRRRAGTDEIERLVPRGWGNAIEGLCEWFRDHVARPALGEHTDRFIPYIWSVFFFILTCNVLGIIPLSDWTRFWGGGHVLGGTSTGNIWVTGALAVSTLFMIIYNGLKVNGMAYVKHFFMGPPGLNVFIAVLEVIGLLAKTFALAMRLFANMVAGHTLLAVLIGFVSMAGAAIGAAGAVGIAVPVVVFALFINLLELFVAFLQAFIFTFLTAMFLGQAINIPHNHMEHLEEHAAALPAAD
jgi:F-type H+-transporting ATPase subunit a